MKYLRCLLTSSLIIVSFLSLTAVAIDYKNISNVTDRIETPAYSILPPQESGWRYGFENPIKIHLGKMGTKEGQSFTGIITMSRISTVKSKQDFFDIASTQRASDAENPRYESLINDEVVSTEKGLYIFRFHTKYRDYSATNLPAESTYLIVEDFGASIQHPYNSNVAVNIALSQRSKQVDLRDDFEELAREFISNIRFREFVE